MKPFQQYFCMVPFLSQYFAKINEIWDFSGILIFAALGMVVKRLTMKIWVLLSDSIWLLRLENMKSVKLTIVYLCILGQCRHDHNHWSNISDFLSKNHQCDIPRHRNQPALIPQLDRSQVWLEPPCTYRCRSHPDPLPNHINSTFCT